MDSSHRQRREALDELERRDKQSFSDSFKSDYIQGADELDLVRAGLDDTMREAYNKIRETLLAET